MKDLSVKTKIIIAIIGIVIVTTIGLYYIKFTNENNLELIIPKNYLDRLQALHQVARSGQLLLNSINSNPNPQKT